MWAGMYQYVQSDLHLQRPTFGTRVLVPLSLMHMHSQRLQVELPAHIVEVLCTTTVVLLTTLPL